MRLPHNGFLLFTKDSYLSKIIDSDRWTSKHVHCGQIANYIRPIDHRRTHNTVNYLFMRDSHSRHNRVIYWSPIIKSAVSFDSKIFAIDLYLARLQTYHTKQKLVLRSSDVMIMKLCQ